ESEVQNEVDNLDGLFLILHGAMVSADHQDVEGFIIRKMRGIMGNKPIAVTLDMHGNISDDMVRHSDIIVGYDTYPHIDMYERSVEASELLVQNVRKQIKPVRYLAKTNV